MRTDKLLRLQAFLSPSFPTGAFAYSHGLEWAVENGDITDAATLEAWILDLVAHGGIRSDLILAACSARVAGAGEWSALQEIAELAVCLAPSRERHLETTQQGRSFAVTLAAAWPNAKLDEALSRLDGQPIAYPVAWGVTIAAHELPIEASLAAYALQLASSLVLAVVRLGTIGQTDGQRVIAGLAGLAEQAAGKARDATLADLGSATFRSDIASLRHETQYSRLFRS